jgi:hypothetical protein
MPKLLIAFRNFSEAPKNASDESYRENRNTHFMFSINLSRKLCHLGDKVEKYGRAGEAADDSKIWRMRFACWVPKAADTQLYFIILNCFSAAAFAV